MDDQNQTVDFVLSADQQGRQHPHFSLSNSLSGENGKWKNCEKNGKQRKVTERKVEKNEKHFLF